MIIKILNLNIHKGVGWHSLRPTFKNLERCILELKPDLIFFQEILGSQAESLVLDIWSHYGYGKNVSHPTKHYGNAILSKFPIIFSENLDLSIYALERRGLLHSIIMINEIRIHLLCVHLGLFRRGREVQLKKLVDYVKATIDENDLIILAGDFNDWTSYATLPLIQGLGLQEAFLNIHGAYARTFPAWAPIFKLDRLYYRGLEAIYAERLTQTSWSSLSDHIGLEIDLKL